MKKITTIPLAILFLVYPLVTYAAWWNPMSWGWVEKIFKSTTEPTQEQSVETTVNSNTEEIDRFEQLNRKIEELEKKLSEEKGHSESESSQTKTKDSVAVEKVSVASQIKENINSYNLSNREIIDLVKPAVVYIETSNGSGSGFIFDSSGYILTNAHVVEGSSNVEVTLSNKRKIPAYVVGINNLNSDVAVLKLDNSGSYPVAKIGDSDDLFQGDEIFAFGFPLGVEEEVSFKEGTLSRRIESNSVPYLEMSTEIMKGNSGGPLVNGKGQIIGINTLRIGSGVDSLRLAIAVNYIKTELNDLKAGKQLLKNKSRNEAESTVRSRLTYLNTQLSDNKEISNAISNAYNESSFSYYEKQISAGVDSITESQENLRKSYLVSISGGYKKIVEGIEVFKNILKSFNDFYSTNQADFDSINNNFARSKLGEFSKYSLSKTSEYDKKIADLYSRISAIEDVLRKGKLKELPTSYFIQQGGDFKLEVKYISTQKDDFINRLWIKLLF